MRRERTALWIALALVAIAAAVLATSSVSWAWYACTSTLDGSVSTGTWLQPYRLELGTSTARHWEIKDVQPARVLPIAGYDAEGDMALDFGDEVRNNSNASPDVFRLVSTTETARDVAFTVSGDIARFVTVVRLNDTTAAVLEPGATESVYIKISVPDDAELGDYNGVLIVTVAGWDQPVRLPMTITVRGKKHRPKPDDETASPVPTPQATPLATSSATPSPSPAGTPVATPAASPSPAPTPIATPAGA